MIFAPPNATADELFNLVHAWLGYLEAEDYAGAVAASRCGPEDTWPEHFLRLAITRYKPKASVPKNMPLRVAVLSGEWSYLIWERWHSLGEHLC